MQLAIIWPSAGLIYWRVYVSLDLSQLKSQSKHDLWRTCGKNIQFLQDFVIEDFTMIHIPNLSGDSSHGYYAYTSNWFDVIKIHISHHLIGRPNLRDSCNTPRMSEKLPLWELAW